MDATVIYDLEKLSVCRTSGDGMEQVVEESKQTKTQQQLSKNTNPKDNVVTKPNRTQLHRKDSIVLQEEVLARKATGIAGGFNSMLPLPGLHTLYRRPEVVTRSLAPVIPKGELILLKPRLIKSPATTLPEHKKSKQPKFVPFEPYPGAVNPIVPRNDGKIVHKVNKNNLDIGVLVNQMSTMRSQELQECDKLQRKDDASSDAELHRLREELRKTQEERDHFQAQFKFQTQVNSELKNLLVASVGEDLQTRVNVLTEDKLQLARALLDTANNLTTHTEQIEFLAGQCEVWRSKFLASSVMVEELARWKADLTQKNQMLNESTKQLLHATHQIREIQLDILKHLKFLAKIRYLNLPATDVISLSAENLNILQQMVLHSGVGMPEDKIKISSANTNPLCEAEKYAVQALEFISQPLMATDDAIRALFGQAQRPYGAVSSVMASDQQSTEIVSTNS